MIEILRLWRIVCVNVKTWHNSHVFPSDTLSSFVVCPSFSFSRLLRLTGTGTVEALPRPAPRPTATTRITLTDGAAHPAQKRQRRKVWRRGGKKRQKRMTSHFPLGCSCFCTLFVWFDYFKCTLFLFLFPFSYCSALVIIMLVWLAECTDARVEMCVRVCCVHAGVVLLSGGCWVCFPLLLTCYWGVFVVGEWEGGRGGYCIITVFSTLYHYYY